MGRLVVKLGERFLEWSSVVDAPVTELMTEHQFRRYLLQEYGASGLVGWEQQRARLDRQGTSSRSGLTLEELLQHNRAGQDEACVTSESEMVALYAPGGSSNESVSEGAVVMLPDVLEGPEILLVEQDAGFQGPGRYVVVRINVLGRDAQEIVLQALGPDDHWDPASSQVTLITGHALPSWLTAVSWLKKVTLFVPEGADISGLGCELLADDDGHQYQVPYARVPAFRKALERVSQCGYGSDDWHDAISGFNNEFEGYRKG